MNRFVLPFLAMAVSFPVSAQTTGGPWAGNYLGVQLGNTVDSSLEFESSPGITFDLEGVVGGGYIGRRWQNDELVYGGELEFLVSEPDVSVASISLVDTRVTTTRVGGTIGYDLGRVLPYATAGIGRMTFQDTVGFGDTSSFGVFGGLGFEYQIGSSTGIGLEVVRQSFENFNEGNDAQVNQTNVSVQLNIRY